MDQRKNESIVPRYHLLTRRFSYRTQFKCCLAPLIQAEYIFLYFIIFCVWINSCQILSSSLLKLECLQYYLFVFLETSILICVSMNICLGNCSEGCFPQTASLSVLGKWDDKRPSFSSCFRSALQFPILTYTQTLLFYYKADTKSSGKCFCLIKSYLCAHLFT